MSKIDDRKRFEFIMNGLANENPLGAREKPLDPYSLCWCKSGKKWKFCHRIRHLEKPISFGQFVSLINQAHSEWVRSSHVCLHPSASASTCSRNVINSHTVQKNGGLSAIAEANHVLSTKKGFLNIEKNDGEIIPTRVGLKDASTFPGFCSTHDTSMFLPVERPGASVSEENAFLLSFRALAYEYVMKCYTVASDAVKRDYADRGKSFPMQVATQSFIDATTRGTQIAIEDLTRWKAKYDKAYQNNDYSSFNAYMICFDSVLPFVGAGAFMPEFDLKGNGLQYLGVKSGLEHLAINVTVLEGVTVAVFGWWPESSGAASRFVESFANIADNEKAAALATCLFEHLENVYYRQSWWEGLSSVEQRALDERTRSGIVARSSTSLTSHVLPVTAGVSRILDIRRH